MSNCKIIDELDWLCWEKPCVCISVIEWILVGWKVEEPNAALKSNLGNFVSLGKEWSCCAIDGLLM